ncbi:MAG: haloacid dehalogenase [Clostridia bacterium]|nr:haloacid dehalogenase [Clostridia bacterium]
MTRTLFACDIDNTLICSRKHPHAGWRCVEWIHDEEHAFMPPAAEALLGRASRALCTVLVTSRSIEQYGRLRLPGGPPAAVTANGADLLVNGQPDPAWRAETEALLAPWREELRRCHERLKYSDRYIRCRMVDDAYLFVYCRGDVDPVGEARAISERTGLAVAASGKKIYLLPPPLNKGSAFARLMERFGCARGIAAGDSAMDLPMLRAADAAILPATLADAAPEGAYVCPAGRSFPEFALETAIRLA